MKTPYIPHLFGDAMLAKLKSRTGWLTSGVASSVPWPQDDVWIEYDGNEYVLRGNSGRGDQRPPGISTPCKQNEISQGMSRLYRLASVLGWFKGGFVDLTYGGWSTAPTLFGSRETFATTLEGAKYFSCNYMPIIEDDRVRIALAFMREGRRLRNVHEPYAFLSFFKVIESQFTTKGRVAWINANLGLLDGDAAKRVAEMRADNVDVGMHLFESGRCAVAHAGLGKSIVDPDIPADRKRIAGDLVVMEALATRYLSVEAAVPDERTLYSSRDRTTAWHSLIPAETLVRLQAGELLTESSDFGKLEQMTVSVRLWPHDPVEPLRDMNFFPKAVANGVVIFHAHNERQTIHLSFALDFANGLAHTMLDEGGMTEQANELTEVEVEAFTRYFHSVIGNHLVELLIDGMDPLECKVVIPVNIIPRDPEEVVTEVLAEFRQRRGGQPDPNPATNLDPGPQGPAISG